MREWTPLFEPGLLPVSEVTRRLTGLVLPAPHQATPEWIERLEALAALLAADTRLSVNRLGVRLSRRAVALREERRRAAALVELESGYCPPDTLLVVGVDEVGRGPLAGPVVAAAVVLKPGAVIPGLADSKVLSQAVREEVCAEVRAASLDVGIGVAGTALVERLNVLEATYVAMRRAVKALKVQPGYGLVDGFRVPGLDLPHRGVVGGDGRCGSIAAASIAAKVFRDGMMRKVALRYPGYGFERNKGYATAEHLAAIRRLGPCPAHRASFLKGLRTAIESPILLEDGDDGNGG